MKIEELEREALALTENERVMLVTRLLDALPPAGTDISDAEIEQRESDLASGKVSAISHEEFVQRVQQARGR
jgi:putative addiction module component (TIGR02574 family)